MFTIAYPMFERGRIMKKELLLGLRDYSFGLARLQFDEWTEGIISGCAVSATDTHLIVAPGVLKFNKFVYVMTESQHIVYEPTERTTVVKICFSTSAASAVDFVAYRGKIVLDSETALGEDELEICRFKLKLGSRLRCDYIGFEDMQTEYDTINLAHATWAGIERRGIALPILRQFAREAIRCHLTEPWDVTFCSQCMNGETVHRSVIETYAQMHGEHVSGTESNVEIYHMLERILNKLRSAVSRPQNPGRKRMNISVE